MFLIEYRLYSALGKHIFILDSVLLKFATYNTSCIYFLHLMQASQSFSERLLLLVLNKNNNNKKWPLVAILTCCKYLTCLKCGDQVPAQHKAEGCIEEVGVVEWRGQIHHEGRGQHEQKWKNRAKIHLPRMPHRHCTEIPPYLCHCFYVILLVLNSFITT